MARRRQPVVRSPKKPVDEKVLAYHRQNGAQRLTPKQARRIAHQMRKENDGG